MPWYRKLHWQIIAGLVLGLIVGVLAVQWGFGDLVTDWLAPLGTVFVNLLKLIAIPLILASLVVGVTSLSDTSKLSRIGSKTIAIYLGTTVIALVIGLTVVNLVQPGQFVSPEMRADLEAQYVDAASEQSERALATDEQRGPLQPLVDIVPDNFASALTDNRAMLQIVFVALAIGIGLLMIPAEKSAPLLAIFDSINTLVITLVDLIMRFAPIGVFGLLAGTIVTIVGDDPSGLGRLLAALGGYCLTVLAGLLIHTFVVYPLLLRFAGGAPITTFLTRITPAQLIAFSSSSSGATLPVTMEVAEERLGISKEVSSFVLPIGATINMDGTGLYQAVAAVFIAQVFGMDLTLADQITIVLTAVLASIGTAAVPSAGIVMLVIILESVNIPSAGIALILGPDRILDMARTVTNVTGDLAVCSVVASTEGQMEIPAEVA
jgi:Na+/H+-dicarboxylate symporter